MVFKKTSESTSKSFDDNGNVINEVVTIVHSAKDEINNFIYSFNHSTKNSVVSSVTASIIKEVANPVDNPDGSVTNANQQVQIGNIWRDNGSFRANISEGENFVEIVLSFDEFLTYIEG